MTFYSLEWSSVPNCNRFTRCFCYMPNGNRLVYTINTTINGTVILLASRRNDTNATAIHSGDESDSVTKSHTKSMSSFKIVTICSPVRVQMVRNIFPMCSSTICTPSFIYMNIPSSCHVQLRENDVR